MRTTRATRLAPLVLIAAVGGGAFERSHLSAQTASPVSATAVVAGVVVKDGTTEPVRRAEVTLNNTDRSVGRTFTTDTDGRFVFRDLPAGRYTLQAQKTAWITSSYGAKTPGRPGVPLVVAAGAQVVDVVLGMAKGAVITGTLRDQTGAPLPDVQVGAMRFVWRQGARVLETVGLSAAAWSDNEGRYRAYGLPPGEYLAFALSRPNPDQPVVDYRPLGRGDVARVIAGASILRR